MEIWMATAFADPAELVPLVQAAERSGYAGIAVSDHLFYAKEHSSTYPYSVDGAPIYQPDTPWPDPWVTIGHLAGLTERLRFTTNVYIAPARDLFTVAKAVSTASVLSAGRVSVGVGAGWSQDEFAQTGQGFEDRGRRLNEMIPALRELWGEGWHEFHGDHYDFEALTVEPTPPTPIRILVGGHSPAALRRAARHGDGWIGTYYKPDQAEEKLAELGTALAAQERALGDGFEVLLSLLARPDVELYRRFADLGVTGMIWAPWMMAAVDDPRFASPLEARIAAIEEFGEQIVQPLSG